MNSHEPFLKLWIQTKFCYYKVDILSKLSLAPFPKLWIQTKLCYYKIDILSKLSLAAVKNVVPTRVRVHVSFMVISIAIMAARVDKFFIIPI